MRFTLRNIVALVLLALLGHAARAQLAFDRKALDFGSLPWYQDGTAQVKITNHGQSTVTINDVVTSSCQLRAALSGTNLERGESATITLRMDASMLGHFEKRLLVYATGSDKPCELKVTGRVVLDFNPFSSAPVELSNDDYPYVVGDLGLNTDNLEFDNANLGDRPVQVIEVHNGGRTTYTPQLMHLPSYLTQQAVPGKILPGHKGRIYVTFHPDMAGDFGLKQTSVYLSRYPGDLVSEENELAVSAVVLPPLDEAALRDTLRSPRVQLSAQELVLPDFHGKRTVKGQLRILNQGNSPLEIKKLQVFHPALGVSASRQTIKPGAYATLKVSVQSAFLGKSRSRLRILMITNDPRNPKHLINVLVDESK